ncbi:Zinc finger RING/FYVE/PHD-type protein [Dioscorea alata]|uniref:Zinc finger RING/FYVE/PHD-type protein n=1 Tax=Dioscorea alata TaxID=55571 RepID=A0ACB7V2F6_DIOAL|nr:Zinc finger RING/FYVE/PHD-type protein [Dioscorea alata]
MQEMVNNFVHFQRDFSGDPGEPHWRINSSFSPPLSRLSDCRSHSDGLSQGTHRVPIYESSFSLHNKGRSRDSDQYPIHYQSVSDGTLSSCGSPSDSFRALQWTTPTKTSDFGPKSKTSVLSESNEECFQGVPSMSNSITSPSPCSESSQRTSACKQPIFFPSRNYSGRRSFISKPVYPLIFHNPISDYEANDVVSATSTDSKMPPVNSFSTLNLDLKFQNSLAELQQMEGSPEPGASSRREGFRLSSASSYYDFGSEPDAIDITESISIESLMPSNNLARYQKCGLCKRFLWQKSLCSSYKIVRNCDLPIAAILPCDHIFHAECLEEITPKNNVHDPPCPQCLKSVILEGSTSFSEPFKISRGSATKNQEVNTSHSAETDMKQRGFLIKDHFKKRFSKDLFSTKVFKRNALPSSSASVNHNTLGCIST